MAAVAQQRRCASTNFGALRPWAARGHECHEYQAMKMISRFKICRRRYSRDEKMPRKKARRDGRDAPRIATRVYFVIATRHAYLWKSMTIRLKYGETAIIWLARYCRHYSFAITYFSRFAIHIIFLATFIVGLDYFAIASMLYFLLAIISLFLIHARCNVYLYTLRCRRRASYMSYNIEGCIEAR